MTHSLIPDRTIDVRCLPNTRETIAYQDGGLFPILATAGDAVVGALRGGAGHNGRSGRIDIIRSLDGGRTWSPPLAIADSDRDDRNPAFGVSPQGTLVLAYQREGCYGEDGSYVWISRRQTDRPIDVMITRSVDAGLTWEAPYPLGVPEFRTDCPFGKIIALPDGILCMTVYLYGNHGVTESAVYLLRSTDDGRIWGDPTLIARGMGETGLVALSNGTLLAVMRGADEDQALWATRSDDGGRTWSEPAQVTARRRHPADLVLLESGDILLTYGNRMPPYRIEGRISRDGGRTWLDLLLTFSAPLYGYDLDARSRTDLGYPSTVILRGEEAARGVTVYYCNPSIPHVGDWRTEGPNGVFYLARDYRAIAVSWDETELLAAVDRVAPSRP